MRNPNDLFQSLLRDTANTARDRASWEGASAIERATFGKIFSAISGLLGLVFIIGCVAIMSATQDSKILTYICGIAWLVPFAIAGTLLARFRHSIFVRIRGIISGFMGGGSR